jgi:hypothetical protein
MDWNWFFSSLSQSSAAIVGIFGAFIITKILTNQTTFAEKNNRIKDLIVVAEKIKDDTKSLYFEWYNKLKNSREFEKIEELLENDAKEDVIHIYHSLNFSIYTSKSVVLQDIENILKERHERLKREQEKTQQNHDTSGFNVNYQGLGGKSVTTNINLSEKLREEREAIERIIRDARHHIRLVSDFLDSVKWNPESSPQIAYSLFLITILFYVGVIYPLSFMPVPTNAVFDLSLSAFIPLLFSLKGALLFAVSLVFTVALFMFFVMNAKMKYSEQDLQHLEALTELGTYSRYFAVMEENEKTRENPEEGQLLQPRSTLDKTARSVS